MGVRRARGRGGRGPEEDAMALENRERAGGGKARKMAVPRLAHSANFDDFDPLLAEPDVELVMVPRGQPLPGDADLVILGASLRRFGFFADLADRIAERVDSSVLLVEANDTARRTFLGRMLEKFIY